MAHFAEIENGFVTAVLTVENEAIAGGNFPESEPLGQELLAQSGFTGTYLQCSYSGSFRGGYPGQGWTYDADLDEFVSPVIIEEVTP